MTPSSFSIEALFREHGPYLQRLARALVGDLHRAEDLVSETWAVALAAAEDSVEMREPRGWLATVMRRRARHGYRREALRQTQALTSDRHVAGNGGGSDEVALRLERERLLHEALERLDEPYRTALYHRYRDGLPPREIAARTGVPVKTVNTRLTRGLEKLREDLARGHGGGEEGRRAWLSAIGPIAVAVPRYSATWLASRSAMLVAAAALAGVIGVSIWARASRAPEAPISLPGGEVLALAPEVAEAREAEPVSPEHASLPVAEPRKGLTAPGFSGSEIAGIEITALSASGAPLAEERLVLATIRWSGGEPRAISSSVTDAAGKATFDWPGTNHFICFNAARTIEGKSDVSRDLPDVPPAEAARYTFREEPGLRVGGVVRDGSGAPVPGARVFASGAPEWSIGGLPVATCDVSGAFEVTLGERASIMAAAAGMTASTTLEVQRLAESAPGLREVILVVHAEGAQLSGRVSTTAGDPIAGAWVVASPVSPFVDQGEGGFLHEVSAQTNEEGEYVLPGKLRPREYEVAAFAPGYAARILPLVAGAEPIRLDLALGAGVTVRGRVLVDDDTPVQESNVRYRVAKEQGERDPHGPYHAVSTDEAGRFELQHVPAGTYLFVAGQGRGMTLAKATLEQEVPEAGTLELELHLSFEPRISGRVVDEAGLPVPGLHLEPKFGGRGHYVMQTVTDAEGKFDLTSLPAPPWYASATDTWSVQFFQGEQRPRQMLAAVEDVEPGTTGLEVVVARPVEPGSFLTGRFVRSDGPISPAVKIFVAQSAGHGALGAVDVDPVDGSFTYGPIGAGTYRFFVDDPNGNSVGQIGIEVADGETVDLGDIDMARGARAEVTLEVELPDGVPITELPGLLRNQYLVLEGPGGHQVGLLFDETNHKTEGLLEPGEWRLSRRSGERLVLPATTLTVQPGETRSVALRARVARPMDVRVLMPTDGSWSRAALRVYGEDDVELETSEALPPTKLDEEERLSMRIEVPIEIIRVVLVIDGVETAHVKEVMVPFFTEPLSTLEIDAR
ncbi:sigma-70 family RNA polymerase sigma factor [Saltatorellus ferox]